MDIECPEIYEAEHNCVYISREALAVPSFYILGTLQEYYEQAESVVLARLRHQSSHPNCEYAYNLEVLHIIRGDNPLLRSIIVCGGETVVEDELWRSISLSENHERAVRSNLPTGYTSSECEQVRYHSSSSSADCYWAPTFHDQATYIISWGGRFSSMSFEPYLHQGDAIYTYVRSFDWSE